MMIPCIRCSFPIYNFITILSEYSRVIILSSQPTLSYAFHSDCYVMMKTYNMNVVP